MNSPLHPAPEPYWTDGEDVRLFLGDCLDVMRQMDRESVDAVVTDPPYGLADLSAAMVARALTAWLSGDREHVPDGRGGFMGRRWDRFVPPPAAWGECLRVLKPGGWLLAFAAPRTADLMTLSIRLAGFEIRDSIDWIYASGFPKGLNVGKAIDKAAGAEREIVGKGINYDAKAKHGGTWTGDVYGGEPANSSGPLLTAPATPEAAEWEGWDVALKPAHEPIVLARKPLAGTVVQNVLAHGTGALNIGACRVSAAAGDYAHESNDLGKRGDETNWRFEARKVPPNELGRWPSNVLFSHSAGCEQAGTTVIPGNIRLNPTVVAARANIAKGAEAERRRGARGHGNADGTETVPVWICQPGCPVAELDRQSGASVSTASARQTPKRSTAALGDFKGTSAVTGHADSGSASRFFPVFKYEAKAPQSERPRLEDGTAWPTVKPLELMRWLARLVTPPRGLILDPFCGTGTTASAALIEGFRCVLIERDPVAAELAKVRLAKPVQPVMFGGDL